MAAVATTRRFGYYARLSRKDQATYRTSDAIAAVPLTDVPALAILARSVEEALASGKRVRVAKAATAFIHAFLAQVGAPGLKIHVREVRPDLEDVSCTASTRSPTATHRRSSRCGCARARSRRW